MKKICKYIISLTVLLLFGCVNKEDRIDSTPLSIYPLKSKLVNNFDSIIDSVTIIPFEQDSLSYIIHVDKMLLANNSDIVILNNRNILLFDKNGHFRFQIGNVGKGPGEYVRIMDISIDYLNNEIYVLDCYNSILKYSLKDGHYINNIKLKWNRNITTFDAITIVGSFIYSYESNPPNVANFDDKFYNIGKCNLKGTIMKNYFLRKDFCFPNNRFTNTYKHTALVRPFEGSDILYEITGAGINARYHINFEKEFIPNKYLYKMSGTTNPLFNIKKYMRSEYFKLPMGFLETEKLLYFYCAGPKGARYEYLFDKENLYGIYWVHNDKFPFEIMAASNKTFYTIYNETPNNFEQSYVRNPLKEYLENKYNLKKLTINNNPFIIKIKFKY